MSDLASSVNPTEQDSVRLLHSGKDRLKLAEESSYILPFVDADSSTEAGLILLGIDIELLIAGLFLAGADSTVAQCFEAADVCRHRGSWNGVAFETMLSEGHRKYDQVRALVDQVLPLSGSPRQAWEKCSEAVIRNLDPKLANSEVVFLTACLFRHHQASGVSVGRRSGNLD